MTHRTRTAALAAATPTAGLVLALFFATAAAAPEAVPPSAPAPTATSAAADAPAPAADPADPIRGVRSSATSDEGAATPEAPALDGLSGGEPAGSAPREPPVGSAAPVEQVPVEQVPVEQVPVEQVPVEPVPVEPEPDPVEQGAGGVDVGVAIDPPTDPGALAMTVAGDATALSESGSTAAVRRFVGALPTVTVRDTRTPDGDRPGWSVLGSATALTGTSGQPPIGVEHLGWTPRLLEGDAAAAGPVVLTVLDGGSGGSHPGLVEAPLLTIAEGARPGRWTADAELVLQTPAGVRAGRYTAVLTLSLFE